MKTELVKSAGRYGWTSVVHRSGPIGPPERVPGLQQVLRHRNPHPGVVRWERTALT